MIRTTAISTIAKYLHWEKDVDIREAWAIIRAELNKESPVTSINTQSTAIAQIAVDVESHFQVHGGFIPPSKATCLKWLQQLRAL